MRGSISKKGRGSWQLRVELAAGPDGSRKRYFETIRGGKKDAQRRLAELLVNVEKGAVVSSGRVTLADYLHSWLEGYVGTSCSMRTVEGYQSIIDRHLIPSLGHIQLKQLQPQTIQEYYTKALQTLSARTVHHHHRVLSEALKYAVKRGFLGRNPCELVDAPSPKKKLMRTLIPSEVDVLFSAASDSPYYPIFYTAVSSGLRQGELLALRWRDADLDVLSSLSVSRVLYKRRGVCEFKEPKTSHSRRRVAMTPKLALFLKGYKREQELTYLELGKPFTLDELIFPNLPEGKPTDPCVLSHAFARIARQAGLEGVRFHDLRHTFASLMLLRGAKPKVISEALGHSSVAFTMDVYSHIISGMQEDAMALLDDVLPRGVSQKHSVTYPSPNFDVSRS